MINLSEIKWQGVGIFILLFFILTSLGFGEKAHDTMHTEVTNQKLIRLPDPVLRSETSIEEALTKRRSVRDYSKTPLSLQEISQLLWSAQGITDRGEGGRTAPSAGALYPLEVYVVAGNVSTLEAGVYHYIPQSHALRLVSDGDKRNLLASSALMQGSVQRAPAVLVFTAIYSRTTGKYLERGRRYVHMEAGHAAQNVYLQAESLKLGTVVVGAFVDSMVKKVLHIPHEEEPLYLMPVGHK